MTAATRLLLACTLALLLLPCAHAQTRKSFDAWAVVCSGGATGYCTASNRIKSVSGPYRFQLNVTRERPGAAFELALLTGYQHPGDGTAIVIQVDDNRAIKLSPQQGYRRAGRSNTYVIASGEAEQLLKQMRAGKRIRFRFEDVKGAAVDTGFALSGMSAAIGFMEQMQSTPSSRAAAATAPKGATSPKGIASPAADETQSPLETEGAPAGPKPAPAAKETATTPRAGTTAPAGQGTAPSTAAALPATPAPGNMEAAPAGKELVPPRAPAPAVPAKDTTAATASGAKTATAATGPAPASKEPVPAPSPSAAPVAQDVAPTPPAPVKQPAAPASPAPTAARPPAAEATQKPASAPPSQVATAPSQKPASAPPSQVATAPAQPPASEQKRTPAQAQKQASTNIPPPASRKRGAKSFRQFSCRGNEPFWSFVIDADRARYSTPTEDPIELKGKLSVTGEGPTPVIDWSGKSDWGGTFRAVVTEGRCRDTMSDSEGQTEFEFLAQLSVPGGKVVRGCCNAGLPPAKTAAVAPTSTDTTQFPVADLRNRPETDWSRYLFDLLPAIQACIDKTPEPDPYATKAWPMNRGMIGVRTRNAQGGWYECVAEANGKSIERFVTLPPSAPPAPNEDRVMFSPPDHSPPGGNCLKHERVMDGMGDFMGWLSTNTCS